jgi:hypothetical protein
METIPTETKRQGLLAFLTPTQRTALALTNKREYQWMRPILRFMDMPFAQKVVFLKTSPQWGVPDDLVMEALARQHDFPALLSLLGSLPDRLPLKKRVRRLVEDRVRDRGYKKLLKKTFLQMYIAHLLHEHRSVPRFLHTIDSPEVRSYAIEQYLLLKKKDFTPTTLRKWVQRIPDEYTRTKTARTLLTTKPSR